MRNRCKEHKMNFTKIIKNFLCFFLLASAVCATPNHVYAEVLTQNIINTALAQNEATIDLNQTLIRLTRKAHQDLNNTLVSTQTMDENLDRMASDLESRLKGVTEPKRVIQRINQYLFDDQGFDVDRSKLFEGTLDTLLLNQVLKNKKGHCLSLSLIYLCLAERLELPIVGVMVPNHFFIRYQTREGGRINIETTARGATYPDAYYQKIHLKGYDDQVSLKPLSKTKTVAVYLSNLANHYKLQGDHLKAMAMFQKIITVIPRRASLLTNLGNTYERDKQIIKAIAIYHDSLKLNPYLCETHYNLGLAHYYYTGLHEAARKHGQAARKLGCRLHPEFQAFLNKGP